MSERFTLAYDGEVRNTPVQIYRGEGLRSAAFGLWWDGGSCLDPPGKSGLTHLLEHVILGGNCHAVDEVELTGGTAAGTTAKEYVDFFWRLPADQWKEASTSMLRAICEPELDDATVARERQILDSEIAEDLADEYSWPLDVLNHRLWPDDARGNPTAGIRSHITEMSALDLREFHRTNLTPARVALCVVSSATADSVLAFLEHSPLTEIETRTTSGPDENVRHVAEPSTGEASQEVEFIAVGWEIPAELSSATHVVAQMLGGGYRSYLWHESRSAAGLCYSIGADVAEYKRSNLLRLTAVASRKHAEAVRSLLLSASRARLNEEPPQIAAWGRQMQAGLEMDLDAPHHFARWKGLQRLLGRGRNGVPRLAFDDVSADDIAATLEYLRVAPVVVSSAEGRG